MDVHFYALVKSLVELVGVKTANFQGFGILLI